MHRADGYYVQFAVKAARAIVHQPTGKQVGIDVGLKAYYTDSEGNTVDNPRHYRKAEQKLKRLQRAVSRKQKKSSNRKKARKQLARVHLQVQRQREDFARKTASTLISSHDVIALKTLRYAYGQEPSPRQEYSRCRMGYVHLLGQSLWTDAYSSRHCSRTAVHQSAM